MADKLTTQEENGEKVFTVELAPGSEVTMQTADTYVDKNIKISAKVPPYNAVYTGTNDPAASLGKEGDIYIKTYNK